TSLRRHLQRLAAVSSAIPRRGSFISASMKPSARRRGRTYNAGMSFQDVAVVGAGPIGIELAVALKRAGVDYVHFDAKQIGYTISWFAPQTRFFSSNERIAIAGVPLMTPDQNKATREEYLAYLRAVATQFELKVHTYEPVIDIRREPNGAFVLTTKPAGGRRTCRCNRLVLAT